MTTFVANTNVLDLIGLKNEIDDVFINSATVTVTIKDTAEVEVTGQVWPLAMSYVALSDGVYRAFVSETIDFVPKTKYIAYIDANGGANLVGHWEFHFKALTREVDEVV
jgi:hypothetical protein